MMMIIIKIYHLFIMCHAQPSIYMPSHFILTRTEEVQPNTRLTDQEIEASRDTVIKVVLASWWRG